MTQRSHRKRTIGSTSPWSWLSASWFSKSLILTGKYKSSRTFWGTRSENTDSIKWGTRRSWFRNIWEGTSSPETGGWNETTNTSRIWRGRWRGLRRLRWTGCRGRPPRYRMYSETYGRRGRQDERSWLSWPPYPTFVGRHMWKCIFWKWRVAFSIMKRMNYIIGKDEKW